jgi:hypothetical protein
MRNWRDEGVPLRRIVARVEEHGFTISIDAIRWLTDDVPNAVRTRGRRKHASDIDGQSRAPDSDGDAVRFPRVLIRSEACQAASRLPVHLLTGESR